jgi:prolyl oligopeptidase
MVAKSCCSPVALDPSGKTKIGAVVPNRDATRLAVGVYAQGSERKTSGHRQHDGCADGPVITGLDSFSFARDERYAFITPRTAESDANQEPMRCLKHRLGGNRNDDVLLLAVNDAKNYCAVYEPAEADVTVFETGDFWSNTIRIRPLDSNAEAKTIYASGFAPRGSSSATGCTSGRTTTRRTGR